MADKTKDKSKKTEPKIMFEREYIVPLRREWLKVATYKRTNKAVKALKEFMIRHMKVYNRDLRKIKVDNVLNNEIRFKGIRKPPAKIRVKAIKYDNDTVRVELVDVPEHIKYARLRGEKLKTKPEKKAPKEEKIETKEEKKDEKKEIEAKESSLKKTSEKKESIEKEQASRDESLKLAEKQAKEQKHVSKDSKVMMPRKTLSR